MSDQGFTGRNFRHISELDKRKGVTLDLEFFASVRDKTETLKECIKEAKDFRRSHPGKYSADDQAIFDDIKKRRERARLERDATLLRELEAVASKVTNRSFSIDLDRKTGPKGKPVFVANVSRPDVYYALKKLSMNLGETYKVFPANRNLVISQVAGILSDSFSYHIVRTDVKDFFESIPHERLLKKLKGDQILSQTTLKLISQILRNYTEVSGTPGAGLPRGVGISSYLSEIYMQDIDQAIRSKPDVVYYARYVDDIIVIFTTPPQTNCRAHLADISSLIAEKGLALNPAKTNESPLGADGQPASRANWSFEYLGYKFQFSPALAIGLSDSRKKKYGDRILASFRSYEKQRAKNQKAAFRILVERMRFLTGNTRLSHSKSNAYVGIFFSNPSLTDTSDLRYLDGILRRQTARLQSANLQARLNGLSFERGFLERTFRRFHRTNQFANITRAWSYE